MAYLTNQRQHYGICGTFRVLTTGEALLEQHTSEHDGWELTFMPKRSCDPAKMQIRGKAFEYNPDTFLLYNGAETHTEMYSESISSTDTHRVDAIVLHSDFLDRLFAAEGVPAGEILFDGVQFKTTPRITHLIRTLFALRD
ncbi:MAG: hypothetical protein ACXWQO_20085, partial [Bdellovibrionota bacterium]